MEKDIENVSLENPYRLGNLINPSFPVYIVGVFDDVVYATFKGNEGDVWEYKIKDIKKIPINGIWLLKMGFDKPIDFDFGITVIKDYPEFVFANRGFGWHLYYRNRIMTTIKYVHEFQNLFFAIVGTELVMS